jgi:hypothetical protein
VFIICCLRGLCNQKEEMKKKTVSTAHKSSRIGQVIGQWDVELVRQTFHEDDVQTILAISVNEAFEDSIAWHFDKRGIFSVKSAYKVHIDNDSCGQGSSEGAMVYNPLTGNTFPWDKIWKLACPNKVKTFAWRLVHNSLPLKQKIQARGMDIDTRCPVCWRFDEYDCHMLFKCKYVKRVWSELHMENIRLELATLQSPKVVFYCIWDKSEELQLRIIITLWALSMERNNVNAGKDKIHRHRLAPRFRDIVFSSLIFSVNTKGPKVQQTQDGKKQIHNFLKINFDASFSEQTFSRGWGFVITNEIGEAVAAAVGHIENVSNPLQVEVMTCYQALTFAAEQGMVALEVETDCLQLK